MKFYFCETCGKRITEHDIEGGVAKNKKLKGVFCKECAVGVSTMDMMPLTGDQARELLQAEGEGEKQPSARPAPPPAHQRSGPSSHSKRARPAPQTSNLGLLLGVAGVVAILVVAVMYVLFLSESPSPKAKAKATAKTERNQPTVKQSVPVSGSKEGEEASHGAEPVKAVETNAPFKTPAPTEKESEADKALAAIGKTLAGGDLKRAWEALKALDAGQGRKDGVAEQLNRASDIKAEVLERSRAEVQRLRNEFEPGMIKEGKWEAIEQRMAALEGQLGKELADAAGLKQLTDDLEARKAAAMKSAGEAEKASQLKEAEARFAAVLVKFDAAVWAEQLDKAVKISRQAEVPTSAGAVAERAKALPVLARDLVASRAANEKARSAALEKLMGRKLTLETNKGRRTGVLKKVDGETLTLEQQFIINGKPKGGAQFKVALNDLTPAARARLWSEPQPNTANEWLARAVRKLVEKDFAVAEKALASVNAHPLLKHYQDRLQKMREDARDEKAKRFWTDSLAPLLSVKKLSEKEAKDGLAALKRFRAEHGKTKFAASVAEKVENLEIALEDALGRPKELTLDLGEGVKMEFVLIARGTFTMGLKESKDRGDESSMPLHKVTLTKGFYLGKCEVTQAQYERVVGKLPELKNTGPELPVGSVIWQECVDFCRALRQKTGKKARLPTEAEWEYACRAGTTTRFSWGDESRGLNEYCWNSSAAKHKPQPVGRKKSNAWGLYDMHGNVSEWCQDWVGRYSAEPAVDPRGPAEGKARVVRGSNAHWRTAYYFASGRRGSAKPDTRRDIVGMRVLLDF